MADIIIKGTRQFVPVNELDALKLPEGRLSLGGGPISFSDEWVKQAVREILDRDQEAYIELPDRAPPSKCNDDLSLNAVSFASKSRLVAYAANKYDMFGIGLPFATS